METADEDDDGGGGGGGLGLSEVLSQQHTITCLCGDNLSVFLTS